jgi:hypothetical protein
MADDEAFLGNIPKFMRRPQEPLPETPIFMAPRPAAVPPPAQVPPALQAPAALSGRRPGALVPPAQPRPAAAATGSGRGAESNQPPALSEVVDLRARRDEAQVAQANFFAAARVGIETLLALEPDDPQDDAGDAAFQVTLPRSVIRQIRILAAQEGTTQRAIILKALRLAGLSVPEGADIDRRILAGKRRQQA